VRRRFRAGLGGIGRRRPGQRQSTLLLQAAAAIAAASRAPARAAYITGEEAIDQVRLRAKRLGVADSPVLLAAASDVRDILASLDRADAPDFVVVDSIQTMYLDTLDSAPGTVSQVRAAAQELSLIHISEPTRPLYISYAVFCLKK